MRKLVLLFMLAACVVMYRPEPVRATSKLETWCQAQPGASWQADQSRCVVLAATRATVTEPLAILPQEVLSNGGTIDNSAAIDNLGIIDNFGTVTNHGDIHNTGEIYSYSNAILINRGAIDNDDTIGNYGILCNHNTIDNDGAINNYGVIYNLCTSDLLGNPPSNFSGGVTYNLDHCGFLPMVARD